MSEKHAKLDKSKDYLLVRGNPKAKYIQDDKYFDFFGNYVANVELAFREAKRPEAKPGKPAARKPEPKPEPEVKNVNDALSRAADKLGLDTPVGAVPQPMEDAERENARARAAEDNA